LEKAAVTKQEFGFGEQPKFQRKMMLKDIFEKQVHIHLNIDKKIVLPELTSAENQRA